MSTSCPNPDRCRFTGCAGDCEPPRAAAVVVRFSRTAAAVALARVAHPRPSEFGLKTRDARVHRKLLVASFS